MMNGMKKFRQLRHAAYMRWFRCLSIQNNKILLWANNFRAYGDSPKYIAEYILRHAPGKYDLVWVLENGMAVPDDMPVGIRVVRYFSIGYLKEISTAKVVVCNTRIPAHCFFEKRKGQVYIQTWHSSLRLKMIEADAPSLPENYVAQAKADSQKIDLLLSGCAFSTAIFQRAFWYHGEIMQGGTPRCDLFWRDRQEIKQRVYQRCGIEPNAKLALYAPTFRDNRQAQTHGMDFDALADALKASDPAPWVIGCRFHPNLKDAPVPAGCISMTTYPDMQELVAAADMLITDYSSCMFDMAISGGPCVLYAPDIRQYTANERALYFDMNELPFPAAASMEELNYIIRNFDLLTYQRRVKAFLERVGNCEDGHASARVAEYIERKCGTP